MFLRTMSCFVLLTLATACGGDKATAPLDITGTYALQTVNGSALPLNIADAGNPTDILVADTIVLNVDLTFRETAIEDLPVGALTVRDTSVNTGTYTQSGSNITLRNSGTVVGSGSTGVGSLMLTAGGFIVVYHKM